VRLLKIQRARVSGLRSFGHTPVRAHPERSASLRGADAENRAMEVNDLEISVAGNWIRVPALDIDGKAVVVTGRWIKMAAIHDDEWLESELEDPEGCISKLKEGESHGVRADIFTFAQKLPATSPKYPYPLEWDNVAAIRLPSFKDWWENRLPQETRKNVRRSTRRGVVVRIEQLDDALIKGIVEINNDSVIRDNRRFWHYGKNYDEVKKDYLSFIDRSEFICAYLGDELIGLMKMVYGGGVAAIMQLLSKTAHYDKRPSNVLIAKAVERCEQKGLSYLTYGKYIYGNKAKSSLTEFKKRNGFEEILVPRFYVPLTIKGEMCMMLKLHRGVTRILPESVVRLGVNVRAKWYKLNLSARRCSSM